MHEQSVCTEVDLQIGTTALSDFFVTQSALTAIAGSADQHILSPHYQNTIA